MLSQRERLTRTLFARVQKNGTRGKSAFFSYIWRPAPDFRASVVVGKKVAALATRRNAIRRTAYDALRHARNAHSLPNGHYILITMPGRPFQDTEDVIRDIAELSSRLLSRPARPR